jgi:hypothetical protein
VCHDEYLIDFKEQGGIDALLQLIRTRLGSARLWGLDALPPVLTDDEKQKAEIYETDENKRKQILLRKFNDERSYHIGMSTFIGPLMSLAGKY